MPTKERLAKEREKKKMDEALDKIFAVLPEHLVCADLSLNKIAESLDKRYFYNWVTYSDDGETAYKDPHPEKPSNDKRADERRAEAARLKEKYPKQWGVRADLIARKEGKVIRTIQKYFKEFP